MHAFAIHELQFPISVTGYNSPHQSSPSEKDFAEFRVKVTKKNALVASVERLVTYFGVNYHQPKYTHNR